MVIPYIEQLEDLARAAGVDLAEAYLEAGYARNAYWRHVTGSVMVPLDAAFTIEAAIERLKGKLDQEPAKVA